jgi:hypothetical protein
MEDPIFITNKVEIDIGRFRLADKRHSSLGSVEVGGKIDLYIR